MSDRTIDSLGSKSDPSPSGLWDGVAETWHRWIPRMRGWYAPATSLMFNLARIGPGSRVLDVAAGDGDQSLAAAERVGPGGYVLATDPATELLAFARRSAEQAGLENLETRVMEAENLLVADGSFDAVICRFGLMFFSDRDRGLGEMNRVLRSGGRVSLVVYDVEGSPEFSIARSVLRRRLGLSGDPTSATGLAGQGVLEQILKKAGFGEVEVHKLTLPIRMASAGECVRYLEDTSPTLRGTILSSSSPEDCQEVWAEIEQALSKFQTPTGFEVDHRVLISAGTAD